jgi:hypothetical protein
LRRNAFLTWGVLVPVCGTEKYPRPNPAGLQLAA